ncbi:MAG: hypothetical protein WAV38_24285 [Xanthobacteraceae bacterium]
MTAAFKCDGCSRRNFRPAPMLHDEVWLKLADEHETLCDKCMWRRQRERHVSITINSLKPCPVNLAGAWFDMFAALVNAPPPNIDEWRAFACDPWVLSRHCPPHPWLIEPAAVEALKNEILMWHFESVHEVSAFLLAFLKKHHKPKLHVVKNDEVMP